MSGLPEYAVIRFNERSNVAGLMKFCLENNMPDVSLGRGALRMGWVEEMRSVPVSREDATAPLFNMKSEPREEEAREASPQSDTTTDASGGQEEEGEGEQCRRSPIQSASVERDEEHPVLRPIRPHMLLAPCLEGMVQERRDERREEKPLRVVREKRKSLPAVVSAKRSRVEEEPLRKEPAKRRLSMASRPMLQCKACHVAVLRSSVRGHAMSHWAEQTDAPPAFNCPRCHFTSNSTEQMYYHMTQERHRGKMVDVRDGEVYDRLIRDLFGGESLGGERQAAVIALRKDEGKADTVSCALCHESLANVTQRKQAHMRKAHKPDDAPRLLVCIECDFSADYAATVKSHTRKVHGKGTAAMRKTPWEEVQRVEGEWMTLCFPGKEHINADDTLGEDSVVEDSEEA